MRRHRITPTHVLRLLALALVSSSVALGASTVRADDPDLRQFEPFVMVIVDTSGSMERLPSCECEDIGCENCLPKCGAPTVNQPSPSLVSDPAHISHRKNRWGYTLEALTGQFTDFQCNRVARLASKGATFDVGYYLPYHQPWKCSDGSEVCAMPLGTTSNPTQTQNGVLDRYASRLRFGLMTFDGIETYKDANPLIKAHEFSEVLSESVSGMWSYGEPQPFHYPGCSTYYKMDTGARSSIAAEGGLITLNSNACPSPPCSMYQINETIQSTLLRTRPYGGTPIAASLDDLFHHFKTDLTDSLAGCRNRYALLITDGYPDDDYREEGCDCVKKGDCDDYAIETEEERALHRCPYPEPEEVAYRLVNGFDGDPKQMQQLFVIGVSIETAQVREKLNQIALNGGSTEEDDNGDYARFADGFESLTATLDQLFSGLTEPVSRSVPAFVTSHLDQATYRLTAGFQKSIGTVDANNIVPPWTGIVERQRFLCGTGVTIPVGADIEDTAANRDRLHMTLSRRTEARVLRTAIPTGTVTQATLTGRLTRAVENAKCGATSTDHCALENLENGSKVTPALLDITTTDPTEQESERDDIMDWMYGRDGSVRDGQSMGDVYHSSPTVWREGTHDSTDDAYTLFLDRPDVSRKPVVMYIGSNDGILHAFSVGDDYNGATALNKGRMGDSLIIDNSLARFDEGEEMWGFVPPMLIPTIQDQLYSHQFGVDATPVVKDVMFARATVPTGHEYHTVLASGLRSGGKGYFALDVSDPINPQFLWQFTDPLLPENSTTDFKTLGHTYGKPAIVQMDVDYTVGAQHIQGIRAVAVLGGGRGTKWDGTGTAPPGCNSTTKLTPTPREGTDVFKTYTSSTVTLAPFDHRSHVACWNTEGRALYFVDVATGHLIRAIWSPDDGSTFSFPAPLAGSPAMYPDAVGQTAKEGYVMDQEGILWRIDVSSTNPDNWNVKPFHDLYFGPDTSVQGETSFEVPLLTFDDKRNLVVIIGTGDTDNFDKPTARNRIVSLTKVTGNKAALNWEMDGNWDPSLSLNGMIRSELVTGSMALFEGRLFVATFAPKVSSDPCQIGRGRLWSLRYNEPNTAVTNEDFSHPPKLFPLASNETNSATNSATSGVALFNIDMATAPDNTMVFGLGATQLRCPRVNSTDDFSNYFSEKLPAIQESGAPSIWLVAQSSGNSQFIRSNSDLGSINVKLNRDLTFAKMTSWASSTD